MSSTTVPGSFRIPLPFGLTGFGVGFLALLGGGAVLAVRWSGSALAFSPDAFANISTVFAPLLVVAAFIERAVEVILTPMRGARADMLQAELDAASQDPARAAEAARLARDVLNYKLNTRHYAFLLSSALGMVGALVGLRGVSALLQDPRSVSAAFRMYDVLMTGVVVGGGADGIHKMVSAILSYIDMIGANARKAAAGN